MGRARKSAVMGRARKSAAAVAMLAALPGLALLGTAGSAHAGVSAPARPAAPQAVGAVRYVKDVLTGKCLTVNQQGTANGEKVNQYTCVGQTNQQWQFINRQGTFFYELKNIHSGKCLDDPGFSQKNGTQVDQWTCNGGWNQWWVEDFANQADSWLAVKPPVGSFLYLGISGGSKANDAPAIIWNSLSAKNEYWDVAIPG
jgi:hypothetical protein